MNICLTTFYTPSWESLAAVTIPVMQKYCDKHGYHLNINKIPDGNFHFIKTKDTRKLLEEFDVVMGIEADVLITNMDIRVEGFLDEENELYITTDINNVNFGVFIAKSTQWMKDLFDWIETRSQNTGDEQNLFERYTFDKTKKCEHPCFNSIPYAFYSPSYGRIGYIEGDVVDMPTEKDGNWNKNHFVCHTPGLGYEQRVEILTKIKEGIIYE